MDPPSETENDVDVCTTSNFVQKTCGCTKANGKPCSTLFSVEYYIDYHAPASLLKQQELDLLLLGSILTTVLALLMVDTNQLNEERCQVICIMATRYAKLHMHFCTT